MIADIPDKESLGRREVAEMDARATPLQMPAKNAFLAIWAHKGPFVAVLIQGRIAFARRIAHPADTEVWRMPGIAILLKFFEAVQGDLESLFRSTHRHNLLSRFLAKIQTWKQLKSTVPELLTVRWTNIPSLQPINMRVKVEQTGSM